MTRLPDVSGISRGRNDADVHVAAALDPIGGLLGVREFAAQATGYASLLQWQAGFGDVAVGRH